MLKYLTAILLVVTSSPIWANVSLEMTEEQKSEACANLDWKDPGTYKLPNLHSTLELPVDYVALIGKDANRSQTIWGEPSNEDIEAIAFNKESRDPVFFESYPVGFVTIDDWSEVDAAALLSSISESTEEANKERKEKGLEELHVIGWLQEPTLNRDTNTVYWAIEATSGNESIVNSVALRLGREGYEKIIWATDKNNYVPFGGQLDIMVNAHSFDPGYRYSDYTSGDKLAGYGIAGLVAATVGGKLAKTLGLFILLKKGGAFILAGIAALFYKFKSFFKRKQPA